LPIPLPNELRGPARKSQYDLLQPGVLALPDLEAVLEKLFNVFVPRLRAGKLTSSYGDVLHSAKHKDPTRAAATVIAQQIPLT
jgi:hypothetical protein